MDLTGVFPKVYIIEPIIRPTSSPDIGIKTTQGYRISNRFQFDFIRLGLWTRGRGLPLPLPPAPSLTYTIYTSIYTSSIIPRPRGNGKRGVSEGVVFAAAVNKAICLLCCLRLVL